ncbi:hypothetical protein [Desulfovibrio sp. SGI.133]|uniref:hypothetical protein n=1 Tax=Desulfovibrio sp. SGI.133 TaxID=3420560 RepID=UPI003D06AA5F
MNSAAETCVYLLLLGVVIACAGLHFGLAIGFKALGAVISGIGVLILCLVCFWYGAVGLVHSISWAELTHIEDGKRDVSIILCLGKFRYQIKIPEKKVEVKKNGNAS